MIEISKELLSEILEKSIKRFSVCDNCLYYTRDIEVQEDEDLIWIDCEFKINIYELAYKCKEWALSKDYHINTSEDKFNNYLYLYKMIKDDFGYSIDKINGVQFDSNSYINDLVKACEWIREQIK